jgi:hypothetical protein
MRPDQAATLPGSLLLIRSAELTVEAFTSRFKLGRAYRGRFFYHEKYYNFSLTDPLVQEKFASQEEGDYRLEDVYLCLSLTRPFEIDKRCHKLIAAVISRPVIPKQHL